jgi:hypothetical protein
MNVLAIGLFVVVAVGLGWTSQPVKDWRERRRQRRRYYCYASVS